MLAEQFQAISFDRALISQPTVQEVVEVTGAAPVAKIVPASKESIAKKEVSLVQIERSLKMLTLMNFLFKNIQMLKKNPFFLLVKSSGAALKGTIFEDNDVIDYATQEV